MHINYIRGTIHELIMIFHIILSIIRHENQLRFWKKICELVKPLIYYHDYLAMKKQTVGCYSVSVCILNLWKIKFLVSTIVTVVSIVMGIQGLCTYHENNSRYHPQSIY